MMETGERRRSPRSSPIASTSALPRLSTTSLSAAVRPGSASESHQSEDTALVSDSAFQTPDPGVSALSLPPLSSAPTSGRPREYDDSRQPEHLRDSGIDTSTSANRTSGRFSQSMPNLPPLMPPGEDRPDLWRNDFEPPTFRPRIQGGDAGGSVTLRLDHRDTTDSIHPRPRGIRRIFAFLGYGTNNRYRKELVSLIWNLAFGFVQIIVTLALIIYSSIHRSLKEPSVSEWTACNKPLGLWSCFWIVKVILDCGMSYWGWRRDWKGRSRGENRREGDPEQGASSPNLDPINPVDTNLDPPAIGAMAMDRQRRRIGDTSSNYRLYTRLSLLLSLLIISWFLTTNILLFSSLETCRFSSPHLWWLVFSLLCLQYLVILEVLATAVVVFIIGPLIYLVWSIVLICLGRHPMQNPHYFSPEIGKISKSAVDQIPLVLYIPSPPEDGKKEGSGTDAADVGTKPETVSVPKVGAEHTYPPKQPQTKRRFAFLNRKSSKSVSNPDSEGKAAGVSDEKAGATWEDCWESGDYPFVRLDPNRASCAICLLDFEEPKRRVAREVIRSWARKNRQGSELGSSTDLVDGRRSHGSSGEGEGEADSPRRPSTDDNGIAGASSSTEPALSSSPQQVRQEAPRLSSSRRRSSDDELSLHLTDAGEGAQPLRLLRCGHAFHKTCVDPWLTDVSGRCPTCQRPVIAADPPKNKRNRQPGP